MEHIEYAYTTGMDETELEERLHIADTGVLALARDGEAYAIPLAHYYADDSLYFRLGVTDESEKAEFIETTERARYLLYETEPTDAPRELESWSIIVTGELRELSDETQETFDTTAINRRFSPIRIFGEDIDEVDIAMYELDIDTITGRTTSLQ